MPFDKYSPSKSLNRGGSELCERCEKVCRKTQSLVLFSAAMLLHRSLSNSLLLQCAKCRRWQKMKNDNGTETEREKEKARCDESIKKKYLKNCDKVETFFHFFLHQKYEGLVYGGFCKT